MESERANFVAYVHDQNKDPGPVVKIVCNHKKSGVGSKISTIKTFFKDPISGWQTLPEGFINGPVPSSYKWQAPSTSQKIIDGRPLGADQIEAFLANGGQIDDLEGRQRFHCRKCNGKGDVTVIEKKLFSILDDEVQHARNEQNERFIDLDTLRAKVASKKE